MEVVVGLVIGVVIAFFVYQDAVNWRNEEIAVFGQSSVSPGLWSFGVWAVLIIFLPLYLIQRSSAKGRLTRVCPWCAQRIPIRTTVCLFCRRDVSTGADAMTVGPVVAAAPPTVHAPAGWLPDPTREHQLRYWDGTEWTHHTHDYSAAPTVPVAAPAPVPENASFEQTTPPVSAPVADGEM
jgi:hypothetical protein